MPRIPRKLLIEGARHGFQCDHWKRTVPPEFRRDDRMTARASGLRKRPVRRGQPGTATP